MKSKVVAVLKSPFRLLAWILRLLGRLFSGLGRGFAKLGRRFGRRGKRSAKPGMSSHQPGKPPSRLGKPLARLRGLQGRQRIVFAVVVAVAVVVVVLMVKPGGGDDNKEVRKTLDRFAQATRQKDYQTLCDDLFASALAETIRSVGLPCEVALRTGLESRENPQLTIIAIEVSGDQALARTRSTAVGEKPALETLRLVREDGSWRLASAPSSEAGSGGAP